MIDAFGISMRMASAGLEMQASRLRVATENVANASSTGSTRGADPYVRKVITFDTDGTRTGGSTLPRIKSIDSDYQKPFRIEFDPSNPAADASGYVKMPNVDVMVELADIRESGRSYQANLQSYRQARELVAMTIDLLKS